MGTTQARIFRMARAELGDADIDPKVLTEVYNETVKFCLQQGFWNFALSTATLATQGGTAMFGYSHPHVKPTDYIRTVRVSDQTTFWPPIENYEDARNEIHSDSTPLYMVYVSSATDAGFSLAEWPDAFATYVSGELAKRVARRAKIIGNKLPSEEFKDLERRVHGYLLNALLKDSADGGTLMRQADLLWAAGGGKAIDGEE